MATVTYKFLHFANLKDIPNWSVQYADEEDLGFTKKFPMARIGSFLVKSRDIIEVQDDVEYKQVTLKINNGGVVPRNNGATLIGSKIGTKRQHVIHAGQFIMSKIDARNGAYGIVPLELEGAIVTNDFPVFDVDVEKIIPQFLVLVSTTDKFVEFARKCSSGTTNRKRIDIDAFLNQQIPLPTIEAQEIIVSKYNHSIEESKANDKRADQLEKNIEQYLLKMLGITISRDTNNSNHLISTIRFSKLDRWDVFTAKRNINTSFFKSVFPIVPIGEVYYFLTRTWKKTESTFNYVELGSIDPLLGIINTEEIKTSKAPCRATQVIKKGDLIIGTTRPYLKKFAIVSDKHDGYICSSGFQVIAPTKETNAEFLYEYLKSSIAISQFEYYMTGALYPAITIKDLKKILIPLPPIDIQNSIVAHIDIMKKQIQLLRQQSTESNIKFLIDFERCLFEKER
ncbi:MAG: restriction endonuclease subunit S [Bacteroidales bacterium]|nr:restriction endonuclease subunit S [Candidatus Scybalousia scybalohippi]